MGNTPAGMVSKTAIQNALNQMPEQIPLDVLLDEIIYQYKIELGLKQSKAGEGIRLEDLHEKIKTWKPGKSS